jgi:hypothetical protein
LTVLPPVANISLARGLQLLVESRASYKRNHNAIRGFVRQAFAPIGPALHGSPEAQLLLCCARTRILPDTAEHIAALLEQDLDWQYLVEVASAHRILPLLHNTLTATPLKIIPGDVLADLKQRVLAKAERDMLLVAELARVLAAFNAEGVRAIPFKGPVLAAAVYRNFALRRFYDLDILIHPQDSFKARCALRDLGYQQEGHHAPGWEDHFVEQGGRWEVDLHERVASRYFPTVATFDELSAGCQTVLIQGVPIPTLSAEDLLLVLSIQLAKDCRQWKQRLVQICDTAELIQRFPDLQWEVVLRRARAIGGWRILLLNVLLANNLVEAEVPTAVRRLANADPVVPLLASDVGHRLFPAPTFGGRPLPIGTGMPQRVDSWFHLRARERFRDKLSYVYQFLQDRVSLLVTPTRRDHAFLQLPGRLRPLYYVVRPFRVLLQWVRTGHLKSQSD